MAFPCCSRPYETRVVDSRGPLRPKGRVNVQTRQSDSAAVSAAPHVRAAETAIAAARMDYISRNRRVDGDAEGFARDLLRRLFAGPDWTPAERARFFDAVAARAAPDVLGLVLGCLDALEVGDRDRAVQRARAAAARLANDLFIQELGRRAEGRPAPDMAGRFCRAPFESLETAPGGDVHFCCPAWLPVPIGNLNRATPEEIWNSPAAQAIRASIHDGSYRHCSARHCAHLSSGSLPRTEEVRHARLKADAEARAVRLDRRPEKLVLAHDRSCTLSCPSCRSEVIAANAAEAGTLNRMADAVLLPLARDARAVRVTSSGDPFGSRHFRHVLKGLTRAAYPRLKLEIQTNGVLFTPAAWDEFDLAGRVSLVAVSLDAADPGTYAVVRRGGSFRRLMQNLEFLAARRRAGEIGHLRIDCVVQALNFREMPALVAIGARLGVDVVKFQMIRNWNTWTPAEFATHDIGSPLHPEHEAFLTVVADPAFRAPGVQMWGMASAMAAAQQRSALVADAIPQ